MAPRPFNGTRDMLRQCWRKLQEFASPARIGGYEESVKSYIAEIQKLDPIIIPDDQRAKERGRRIAVARHGLVYAVTDAGILRVFDYTAGTVAYEKPLALKPHKEYVWYPGFSASPAQASPHSLE